MKIEQGQALTVLRRQGKNRAPHSSVAILFLQSPVDGPRITQDGDVINRNGSGRDSPEFGTIQVRRQSKQPRRKGGVFAPLSKCAIGSQKSLLSHILGPSTVAAEPVGEVYQWTLPALNNKLE